MKAISTVFIVCRRGWRIQPILRHKNSLYIMWVIGYSCRGYISMKKECLIRSLYYTIWNDEMRYLSKDSNFSRFMFLTIICMCHVKRSMWLHFYTISNKSRFFKTCFTSYMHVLFSLIYTNTCILIYLFTVEFEPGHRCNIPQKLLVHLSPFIFFSLLGIGGGWMQVVAKQRHERRVWGQG